MEKAEERLQKMELYYLMKEITDGKMLKHEPGLVYRSSIELYDIISGVST